MLPRALERRRRQLRRQHRPRVPMDDPSYWCARCRLDGRLQLARLQQQQPPRRRLWLSVVPRPSMRFRWKEGLGKLQELLQVPLQE